jgi:hypothetical protein
VAILLGCYVIPNTAIPKTLERRHYQLQRPHTTITTVFNEVEQM